MSDPATLAHAVLDTVVPDVPWKIQLQEFQARAAAAPTLARTVIDLAAKVERMDELAEMLERESDELSKFDSALTNHAAMVKARTAARIRAALNGEARG